MSHAEISNPANSLGQMESSRGHEFVTTNWSMVIRARKDSKQASDSLAELCRIYWFPLYAYARQRVTSSHDAEDLVQDFFGWLLLNDLVKRADKDRGRFRTFLQIAFRQFCTREYRKANAQKRKLPRGSFSIHLAEAETRFEEAMINRLSPDRLFDHSWALTVLEITMSRLRTEYESSGRGERFSALAPFLTDEQRGGREACRTALKMTEPAFAMALVRLRQRFGKILHDEIGRTVSHSEDVEDELMQIWSALSIS